MRFPKRKGLKALAAELLIILIGIMLALGLDEWNSERTMARDLEAEKGRLQAEMLRNYNELVRFCSIVSARMTGLEKLGRRIKNGESFPLDSEFFGFPYPELVDAVWQRLARDERSSRMDPEYIEAVYTLYYSNELQSDIARSISDFVFSPTYSDPNASRIAYSISRRLLMQQASLTANSLAAYEKSLSEDKAASGPGGRTCRPAEWERSR